MQTYRPPKTPNLMHSGPGWGFVTLALTRAFYRYMGRGGGGGTKKCWSFHYKHTYGISNISNLIFEFSYTLTFTRLLWFSSLSNDLSFMMACSFVYHDTSPASLSDKQQWKRHRTCSALFALLAPAVDPFTVSLLSE